MTRILERVSTRHLRALIRKARERGLAVRVPGIEHRVFTVAQLTGELRLRPDADEAKSAGREGRRAKRTSKAGRGS